MCILKIKHAPLSKEGATTHRRGGRAYLQVRIIAEGHDRPILHEDEGMMAAGSHREGLFLWRSPS